MMAAPKLNPNALPFIPGLTSTGTASTNINNIKNVFNSSPNAKQGLLPLPKTRPAPLIQQCLACSCLKPTAAFTGPFPPCFHSFCRECNRKRTQNRNKVCPIRGCGSVLQNELMYLNCLVSANNGNFKASRGCRYYCSTICTPNSSV